MPIDSDFQKKRKKVGKEEGIAIWGFVDPPQKLGIRGTYVAVDWDICEGCGVCLEVCPVQLYEWMETSGHPISEKKAFPARETDCVQCYTCENQCSAQAIRVTFGGPSGWEGAVVFLMLSQIIVGTIYGTLFGPYLGLQILRYVGWIVLAVGLSFFFSPAIYFPKKGKPQEGKNLMDTTVVVDSGTYGIVRHPQILGCILLISASILPTLVKRNYWHSNDSVVLHRSVKGGKGSHIEVWRFLQTLYAKGAKNELYCWDY